MNLRYEKLCGKRESKPSCGGNFQSEGEAGSESEASEVINRSRSIEINQDGSQVLDDRGHVVAKTMVSGDPGDIPTGSERFEHEGTCQYCWIEWRKGDREYGFCGPRKDVAVRICRNPALCSCLLP